MIRQFLKFWLAAIIIVFGMAALTEAARADTPLERMATKYGFDLCAPLDAVTTVIMRAEIKVNLFITDGPTMYAYVEDLMNGDQFYVQFYATSVGDIACMKQVWSGMFRDTIAKIPIDSHGWTI